MSAGPSKLRDTLILVGVIVLGVGGIGAYGFYHEEIGGYFRLQGWNTSGAVDATKAFIEAGAAGEGDKIASMVSPKSPEFVVRTDGKVTDLAVSVYGGPSQLPLSRLFPKPQAEIGKPKLIFLNGGTVQVVAEFGKEFHQLDFRWDRDPSGWKLITIIRYKEGQ